VETDEALKFCRVDGTTLVSESVGGDEAGKAQLAAHASEVHTSILPHRTDANIDRATSRTTVLTLDQTHATTGQMTRPKRRRPMVVLAVITAVALGLAVVIVAASTLGYLKLGRPAASGITSIAVLPFSNASGDKEVDFLSEGIAETLINNFTRIPDLKVTARSTAFRYRGREGQPKEIGRELGVGTLLTGSVHKQNDSLTVQVDLIDAADGSQLWGNRYAGKVAEIVNIQQRIAADVGARLKLSTSQARQISRTYTQNAEAYQHYLRGRHYWNKRTADGLKTAIVEFQRAIDLDPTYALAYAGLADCYLVLEQYAAVPNREVLPKAKAAAEQALRIDDSLAEAHTSMAAAYGAEWQWTEGRREYERAIELNPNYPTAHHWYSIHLRNVGRLDESVVEATRAQELDPLSNVINSNLIASYLAIGDLAAAELQAERSLQLDPNFGNANYMLGLVRLGQGRHSEGLAALQRSVDVSGRSEYPLSLLGYGLGISGKKADALSIAKELEERNAKGEAAGSSVATVYAGLGDNDAAFTWLERAYQVREGNLAQINWSQPFVSLRGNPRFRALLQKMNIAQNRNETLSPM
jgi:TolB-like protein/Tfp pilus assembly protein PilF